MKYIIKHGSIAALQYVTFPYGEIVSVTDATDGSELILPVLPLPVRVAINRQFGIVFSLPYEMRQAFIDNSIPLEIEVTE
jgi:hypothetical protein